MRIGRRGPALGRVLCRAICVAIAATQARPALGLQSLAGSPVWRASSGAGLGVLLGPREIGRSTNATGGHEALVAYLGDAGALALHLGIESAVLGVEVRIVSGGRAIQVQNEFGVKFPHHGETPTLWTADVQLFPLFPFRNSTLGRRVQPVATAGIGGLITSVDLDNIDGQSLYHSWQRGVGGGVRFAPGWSRGPMDEDAFVEFRVSRHRILRNSPMHRFDAIVATLGFGIRL